MEVIALLIVIAAVVWVQDYVFHKYAFQGLTYECTLSAAEVFEGDELELVEVVTNQKWLPVPWLKSEITTSKWLSIAHTQSIVTDNTRYVSSFFMLKSYRKVERRWKVKCLKRGAYQITNVTLVSTDLLGNVSLSKPVSLDLHLMVLPRPLELEELFLSPKYLSGDMVVKRHLIEDPFMIAGVREYNERDPINKVHWSATAKEQRLMVYNNECTSRQSLTVILNMQSREFEHFEVIDPQTMENAIRCCASIFDTTIATGIPLRFISNASITNDRTSIVSNEFWGTEHVLDLLRILAQVNLVSTEDFPVFLGDVYDRASSTDLVIVTCYINDLILEFVRNKRADGIAVKIFMLGKISDSDLPDDCEIYCLFEEYQTYLSQTQEEGEQV